MIPNLPKAGENDSMVWGGSTWNKVRSQILRSSAQAGLGLIETPKGENGTIFSVDPGMIASAIGPVFFGPDYDPTIPDQTNPTAGISGDVTLPAGATFFPAGSATTNYAISTLTFTDGLLTAIG